MKTDKITLSSLSFVLDIYFFKFSLCELCDKIWTLSLVTAKETSTSVQFSVKYWNHHSWEERARIAHQLWHTRKSHALIMVMLYIYKFTGRLKLQCSLYQNFSWIIFQSFKADTCGNTVALFSSNFFLHFALGVLVLLRTEATLRLLLIK